MTNAVTQAEFARLQGWQRSYVSQLKREGRLVMTDDGKLVDVAASLTRIGQTRSQDKAGVARRHAEARANGAQDPSYAGACGDGEDGNDDEAGDDVITRPDFQAARARREQARAQREEIELARVVDTLLVAEEVEAVLADAVTNFRAACEGIGALVAAEVAAESDPVECRRIIDEHVRAALSGLANRFGELRGKEAA